MAILMAQHSILRDTGVSSDVTVNTFHFLTAQPVADDFSVEAVLDAVHEFFEATVAPRAAVRTWLSVNLDPATARIKVYDLAQPIPRVPLADELRPLSSVSTSAVPSELAVVLTELANPEPGVPAARRRGRVYIGPLSNLVHTLVANETRVNSAFRLDLAEAGKRLMDYALPTVPGPIQWAVYSRVDNVARPITQVYVDDAFDVQRRRGPDATTRTSAAKGP